MNDSGTPHGGWKRAVGTAFVLAAFAFLGYFIARNAAELRTYEWEVRPVLLALSVVINVISLFLGAKTWQLLLRRMDVAVRLIPLARVWFVSGLGRYIPGKIWQFVGAAHLGGSAGLSPAISVTSLAVHTGIFVIGAVITAVYLVAPSVGELTGIDLQLSRWIAPLVLFFVHPAVISRGLRLVSKVSRRDVANWTGTWIDGITLVVLSVIVWLVNGVAFYVFVASVTPLQGAPVTDLVAINALAFIVGYLVFFVPAGLGAKEGALTVLLSFFVPGAVAAVLAIAARLWMVAAEVIPAVVLLREPARPSQASTSQGRSDARDSSALS